MNDDSPTSLVDPFVAAQQQKRSEWIICPRCGGDGWVETFIGDDGIGRGYPCSCCHGWIEVRR